ncbi:MAG: hypothetical protein KatS3mg110_2193 [Pirellulaceae bacterium]|nr:MAG: hypothetical protein KatS3mg110_2193 [Pirellulaceae bacterium]
MGQQPGRVQSLYALLLGSLLLLCVVALRTWKLEPRGISSPSPPSPHLKQQVPARATLSAIVALPDERPRQSVELTPHASADLSHEQPQSDSPASEPAPMLAEAICPEPVNVDLLAAIVVPPVRAAVRPAVTAAATEPALPEAPLELAPELPGVDQVRLASRDRLWSPAPTGAQSNSVVGGRRLPAPAQPPQSVWPRAEVLRQQLAALHDTPAADWANEVERALDRLEQCSQLSSAEVRRVLSRLGELAAGPPLPPDAYSLENRSWVSLAARARYGLERRVELWRQAERAVDGEPSLRVHSLSSNVSQELRDLEQWLPRHGRGADWRRYLLLDQLEWIAGDGQASADTRQRIAERILARMTSARLTEEQQQFVSEPILARLNEKLRQWAYLPPDYLEFLSSVEAWEMHDISAGQALVEQWQHLAWSPFEEASTLAQVFDLHYRNANIRVAISGDLLNRFLPPVQTVEEDVEDEILGTPVAGRSRTVTRLFVQLIPDRMRWRLGLEAHGQVQSQTWAERGSVTLFTHGATRYRARKLLTIDRHGIFTHHTETEAENNSELANVTTRLDGLPLLGSLLRSLARRTHAERLPEANAEVEQKVSLRVAERLDAAVARRVYEWEKQYRERLVAPLQKLDLPLSTIDMQTTSQRLIARYRLAGDDQLAAYTPRPLAPSDSLLSIQIHESAVNNVLERLRLAGRQASLRELYQQITAAFGKQVDPPENVPDDIVVWFAENDPIRVRFDQNRVDLTLRVAEMHSGRDRWYDFEIHTWFTPHVVGHRILLVRDGVIELRGTMSFADRLPLRAIFTAILARERAIPILDPRITEDPRLADTRVSQLVAVDGWLGLAISPLPKTARPPEPVRVSLSDQTR